MRRLHSRMLGWGSVCGLRASKPSEVFLKGLPPPMEADPVKYQRFCDETSKGLASTEPFYDIVDIAAGAKHFALVTREGHAILVGNNRYGQIGQPTQTKDDPAFESMPYFYDLQFGGVELNAKDEGRATAATDECTMSRGGGSTTTTASSPRETAAPNAAVCGCNFSIFYQRGPSFSSPRAYAVGNNHHGQLGLGHKQTLDNRLGFGEWPHDAPWQEAHRRLLEQRAHASRPASAAEVGGDTPRSERQWNLSTGIRQIFCGFNHTMILMESGDVYACGSNTWGELGIGSTTAPMWPIRVTAFDALNVTIQTIACGSSFTVFLTTCGRVFGCGAYQHGQLPQNIFEPTAVPLVRLRDAADPIAGDKLKLMRIKLVACLADAVVYVTVKNEILLQGSIPDLGFHCACPRYVTVEGREQQQKALAASTTASKTGPHTNIVALHTGGNAIVLEYADGALYGLGSNLDGQITLQPTTGLSGGSGVSEIPNHHVTAKLEPKRKPPAASTSSSSGASSGGSSPSEGYVAPFFLSRVERIPIDIKQQLHPNATSTATDREHVAMHERLTRFAVSQSGVLLLDHAALPVYGDEAKLESVRPIELPPGSTTPPKSVASTTPTSREQPQAREDERPSPAGRRKIRF